MLPALSGSTGGPPPGRHPATVAEVQARFVKDSQFSGSTTRAAIWQGFLSYEAAWLSAEASLGHKIVLAWWLAGSFISSALDPEDIDVTPVLDGPQLATLAGSTGMGKVRALIKHRASVRKQFLVEPFTLEWEPLPSTLAPELLTPGQQLMLARRGGLDSWWGRQRPGGPKAAPVTPKTFADRGYLEVLR